jgi:hypothetical protein
MDIDLHCLNIVKSPRIRGRIVVLCEGDLPQENGRLSPQLYRRNEQLQDAYFYRACVPRYWINSGSPTPIFINSGSRSEVIKTYQRLFEIHHKNISVSNLSLDKLFAIVDLDLQSQSLGNESFIYPFKNIDDAFYHLYNENKINTQNAIEHRIWFTGLIHKEAYFLIPELQEFFDIDLPGISYAYNQGCQYQNNALNLNTIYQDMVDDTVQDRDLADNLERGVARIKSYCENIKIECTKDLQDYWQQQWQVNVNNRDNLNELIYAILSIRKAKPYWEKVHPGDEIATEDCENRYRKFRDDMTLEIGKQFYARQSGEPHQHLAYFFKHLYEFSIL